MGGGGEDLNTTYTFASVKEEVVHDFPRRR